jgi:hypothetical protein
LRAPCDGDSLFDYINCVFIVLKKVETARRFVLYMVPSQYDAYYQDNDKRYQQLDV